MAPRLPSGRDYLVPATGEAPLTCNKQETIINKADRNCHAICLSIDQASSYSVHVNQPVQLACMQGSPVAWIHTGFSLYIGVACSMVTISRVLL